jgi:hypothetical protein
LPGNVPIIRQSDRVKSPAVYVFLRQEAERRLGKSSLLEAVADGLILWGLEETDPGKKILMSRTDLLAKIEATVPPARRFIRGVFDHRLELMASKHNPTGREVRWHKKQDLFALPYETRRLVEEENLEDEASRLRVLEVLTTRAASIAAGELESDDIALLPALALRTFQLTFEREGLEFAAFLEGEDIEHENYSMSDSLDLVLSETNLAGMD